MVTYFAVCHDMREELIAKLQRLVSPGGRHGLAAVYSNVFVCMRVCMCVCMRAEVCIWKGLFQYCICIMIAVDLS